jgi:hypothetical protein
MKKLFVLLFVIGCTGFAAVHAQDGEKVTVAKRLTDSMTVQLSLTEEQVPKVLAVNEEFSSKAAGIRNEGGGKMDKLKKLKAANSERDKALKAILTDDQFLEYKANKKENKALAKERMKARKQK